MALEAKEKRMKFSSFKKHGQLLVWTLGLGASVGCADDHAGTTPVDTTSETESGTTAASEATSSGPGTSTGTTGTESSGGVDPLAPWYGKWYALDSLFTVNEPEWWGNGGNGLAFTLFELRADSATLNLENCLFGFRQFEYTTAVDEDGAVVLEPVGGEHEFKPHGEIERLYIEPATDCSALVVREVLEGGEDREFFTWSGGLKRGELCLEQCAEEPGLQGLISDCGTPVPWECPG